MFVGHVVGQDDGGFALAQGLDDLLHAVQVGGGGAAFIAHAAGLHDVVEDFDFRRLIHGGEREGQAVANVAAGEVVVADVGGDEQQAFAGIEGGLDVFPAVGFHK